MVHWSTTGARAKVWCLLMNVEAHLSTLVHYFKSWTALLGRYAELRLLVRDRSG
jgi:hypothetical protein